MLDLVRRVGCECWTLKATREIQRDARSASTQSSMDAATAQRRKDHSSPPWPWLVRVIPPQASHVEPFLPPREFCTALLHAASYDVGTKKGNYCRRSLRPLQWQAPRAGATSTGLTLGHERGLCLRLPDILPALGDVCAMGLLIASRASDESRHTQHHPHANDAPRFRELGSNASLSA